MKPEAREPHSLSKEIKDRKEELEEKHYIAVDMDLSDSEKDALRDVKVEKDLGEFNYYGPLDAELPERLREYFLPMGDNQSEIVAAITQLVNRLAEQMAGGFEKEAVWVCVRVSLPNDEFEVPRWHPDGSYFHDSEGKWTPTHKLVTTLKGPKTLFGERADVERANQLMREYSDNYGKYKDDEKELERQDIRVRKELDTVINRVTLAEDEQAVVYRVGNQDAVIHSEPHTTEPRIFVQMLTGSLEQIKEWGEKRNG